MVNIWTDIANLALSRLGVELMADLDASGEVEDYVRPLLPAAIRQVGRAHPWNALTDRVRLTAGPMAPAFGFAFMYIVPIECLRVLTVGDGAHPYKTEGRLVITDAPSPLDLLYIRSPYPNDMGVLDADLEELVALRLACLCCHRFTQSAERLKLLEQLYEQRLRQARSTDAQESTPDDPEPSDWLAARGG